MSQFFWDIIIESCNSGMHPEQLCLPLMHACHFASCSEYYGQIVFISYFYLFFGTTDLGRWSY